MKKLKRFGSKLHLYRKDDYSSASGFDRTTPLIEESDEEQGWPSSEYKKFGRRRTADDEPYIDLNAARTRTRTTRDLPVIPSPGFKEPHIVPKTARSKTRTTRSSPVAPPLIFEEPHIDPKMARTKIRTSRNLSRVPPPGIQQWGRDDEIAHGNERSTLANDTKHFGSNSSKPSRAPYGGAEIAIFGPQYEIPTHSSRNNMSPQTNATVFRVETSDPYEDMLRAADAKIQKAYTNGKNLYRGPDGGNDLDILFTPRRVATPPAIIPDASQQPSGSTTISQPFSVSISAPTSCIICTEDFSGTVAPPAWISPACLHPPSICCECLAKCIKSDLENKLWKQIKCPECDSLLIYDDIKRLADPATFSRYDLLSFRSAVGTDSNFVWCRKCDFGQLHDSGTAQPIIRCLNCGSRSCFRHSVAWHERLTCEEYDEMLQDPDGFQSAIDKDDEAVERAMRLQQEEDERLARKLDKRNKHAEQERQRQRHEEERRRARAEQQAEAERKKVEQERARQREEFKRRVKEEKLSVEKVHATTKPCPGCRWPIEKNHGCSHMTCIKCRAEFCWSCLGDYNAIRRHGNSRHKNNCKYHTNNLPG